MSLLQEVVEEVAGWKRWVARRRQFYLVKKKDFTVFSNDCWGAELYKHLERPFNTPFIGLFLMAPCYMEFLRNPRYYASQELVFQETSRYEEINRARETNSYPLATLGGKVEICFLHYDSPEEAREKWLRRVARINWDNLLVKFDGSKDGATPALIREFERMPYKRLLLLEKPAPATRLGIIVGRYTRNGADLFRASLPHFDLVRWLNEGNPAFTASNRMMSKLLGYGG